jgi:hypothetical protein
MASCLQLASYRQSRRIHFRTFSTNVAHPQATLPFLEIHQDDCPAWRYCLTLTHEVWHISETVGNLLKLSGLFCFAVYRVRITRDSTCSQRRRYGFQLEDRRRSSSEPFNQLHGQLLWLSFLLALQACLRSSLRR